MSQGWVVVAEASGGIKSATAVAPACSGLDVVVHYRSDDSRTVEFTGEVEADAAPGLVEWLNRQPPRRLRRWAAHPHGICRAGDPR